jgi:hypothetical protein
LSRARPRRRPAVCKPTNSALKSTAISC